MDESVGLNVNVTIDVKDASTGRLVERIQRHNLVTTAGRNLIRDLLNGVPAKHISHVAVGSGTAAADKGDTALKSERYRGEVTSRVPWTGQLTLQSFVNGDQGNGPLSEAGLFNAPTGGVLFARVVFPTISKSSSLTVTFTWDITIAAGE